MIWYLWFFVIEAVVIVTGNVTVLVVFTRTSALRKRKHYLLVSLAVADLLVGVISVPMYLAMMIFGYTESIWIIYPIQDMLFGTSSVFGLTAVAIERAYAVYFPFKHRTLWKGVYVIGIGVIWMMAAFIASCHFYLIYGLLWLCAVIVPILVSLTVIIVSYFLIWIKTNCKARLQGHAINKRDKRLTVTLLIVTLISLLAWIPFQAFTVYINICLKCEYSPYTVVVTKFLHYSNSLVNPIIYALRMPQFKRAIFNALRCCKRPKLAVQVPNERPEPIRANLIPLAAVQVPNERPEPIRANLIPLATNYDKKATAINDFRCSGVSDETQLNEHPSTARVSVRDGILIVETNL